LKQTTTWHSPRLATDVRVARWGTFGTPVLLFPTAGGDFEECERFLVLDALAPLLDAGRMKLYSVDSVAGKTWFDPASRPRTRARMQRAFLDFVAGELVPAIRADCRTPDIEVVVTGASIGAFNALAALCRHPDLFRAAVCLSGTYDLEKYLEGQRSEDFYHASPLHFVPNLPDDHALLTRARQRFVLLAHGEGRYEDPEQSWRVAHVLGSRRIPNRVDSWGPAWPHDWPTWRAMWPRYLDTLVEPAAENATGDLTTGETTTADGAIPGGAPPSGRAGGGAEATSQAPPRTP